jgi:DNA repair protein RadA/Sms
MPPRVRVQYVCQQCGRTTAKELGRCPQCGAWNSMVGEPVAPAKPRRAGVPRAGGRPPQRLAEIQGDAEERFPLPIEEFSRVLGGGIVPASVVLVGGEPGIGKSTLLLQVAVEVSRHGPVLYISGEESERQIKARAQRLFHSADIPEDLYLLSETDLGVILQHLDSLHPVLAVVDSIQTVYLPELDSSAGSITQVRDCASRLQAVAKADGTSIFLVGHVTKEGAIAGPRVLEHIVDTVLYLEGDPFHAYRLLRSVKNRFGATTEVGVFEMGAAGMAQVANPSEAFLAERVVNAPGSAIAVTVEGTRPLLVEVQGLTSPTTFGHPRRTANGVDPNRLLLTMAVLTRRVGLRLAEQDAFVNVVGGLQVEEPAADLAIAAAVASSYWDRALPADLVVIGEVGLSGELRAVGQLPARLREASRLGFRRAIVPRSPRSDTAGISGLQVMEARSVREALSLGLPGSNATAAE